MHQVMVVVGTRPEIVKMAPVLRALHKSKTDSVFVHCGQHYDYNMSQQFIENLELPAPDFSFKVKVSSPAQQTARIISHMDKLLSKTIPRVMLVEGDTNTVLAAAIAANKNGIPVGHVEAGLRSFDLRMPEEHNRRLTDHLSSYLFAPTVTSQTNLKNEKVWGKIFVTGNTVIDAVIQHMPMAERKSNILENIRFNRFALATAHRAENVDDLEVLGDLVDAFTESPVPVIYSVHPRTRKRLLRHALYPRIKNSKNVQVLPPLGYLDFLVLMKNCEFIITDSGGIQEEATAPIIRKHVLVTRLSTERPEAVTAGFAEVVGTKKDGILQAIKTTVSRHIEFPSESPFGDGTAADKTVRAIRQELIKA